MVYILVLLTLDYSLSGMSVFCFLVSHLGF